MKRNILWTSSATLVAMIAIVLCCITGCNKNIPEDTPSSDNSDVLGNWYVEFYEKDFGGNCSIEYSFQKDGELSIIMVCAGEKITIPMVWRTEEGKLYSIPKTVEKFYDEEKLEWTCVDYKVSSTTLEFYEEGNLTASFNKKN